MRRNHGLGLSVAGLAGILAAAVWGAPTKHPTAVTDGPNTFSGDQTIIGSLIVVDGGVSLPATTSSTVGVIRLGGQPFLHAFGPGSNNVFLGSAAGNFTLTGGGNVGIGTAALESDIVGGGNTAVGVGTLVEYTGVIDGGSSTHNNTAIGSEALNRSTGGGNTSVGALSLCNWASGNGNTAIGLTAGLTSGDCFPATESGDFDTFLGAESRPAPGAGPLTNATAVGALAVVGADNALVLGSIAGVNNADATVNVGIGTAMPTTRLQVADGDVSTTSAGAGLIVKSPDGTRCARIGIDNTGALTATSVTCP